ncbi:MAG TPA: pyridoxamine 5'-phosphate oxidase family protein [Verrucomicrobiae bacterium]|jgi:general stress protein 26|nr:pyridoxamine 5'-phosphate oxidase family protein [Verrucomicrobiae bacterium]
MENHIEKVHSLLTKFDTAMLVTHGRDGIDRVRPMGIAKVEPNCDVWFFTGRASEKTREIEHDTEVLLVCQKDHSAYLSVLGRAQLSDDRAKATELWKAAYKTWFPGGVDDPNLLLIRVNVTAAEYWDNTGVNGIKYLIEAAKAYVTGSSPHVNEPEQHGKVNLK